MKQCLYIANMIILKIMEVASQFLNINEKFKPI